MSGHNEVPITKPTTTKRQCLKCGKPFALVLTDRTKAELVDPDSAKFRRIEDDRPADVVGHYTGYHKRPPRLTVDDFEADIRMTLAGIEP